MRPDHACNGTPPGCNPRYEQRHAAPLIWCAFHGLSSRAPAANLSVAGLVSDLESNTLNVVTHTTTLETSSCKVAVYKIGTRFMPAKLYSHDAFMLALCSALSTSQYQAFTDFGIHSFIHAYISRAILSRAKGGPHT